MSICAGSGCAAPKRPQPLAAFCKFMGMQGALQPWEGPAVVLDGSHGYRCPSLMTQLNQNLAKQLMPTLLKLCCTIHICSYLAQRLLS